MISRLKQHKISEIIAKNEGFVLLLEGARQVGKTTLIREVARLEKQELREINLERDAAFAIAIDQTKNFSEFLDFIQFKLNFDLASGKLLFIDEAQESQKLGSYLRYIREEVPTARVILSGYSMARLIQGRFPVGRVIQEELTPFTFFEFLRAAGALPLLKKLQEFTAKDNLTQIVHNTCLENFSSFEKTGGLPAVVMDYFAKKNWLDTRHQLLLGYRADFRRVYGEEEAVYLWAGMQATALLLGKPFHVSFVNKIVGDQNAKNSTKALSRLEAWRLSIPVPQRGLQVDAAIHPKRYLFDHGIALHLREESVLTPTGAHHDRTNRGGFVEMLVFNILRTQFNEICGWRKAQSGSEVDFVANVNGIPIPIEIKSTAKIKGTHLTGLVDLMLLQNLQVGFLISYAPFEVKTIRKEKANLQIICLPIYLTEKIKDIASFYVHG